MELSEQALRDHENSPSPTQRVGKPRLKPLNAKLCHFYELLVLFEILQRCLGCAKQSQTSDVGTDETSSPWRTFVNQLSWLCDFTQGGDSSSSIAVEDTASGPRYWLAMNFDKKSKGQPHLEEILQTLSKLKDSLPEDHQAIFGEILQSCLRFSSEKFEHYRHWLFINIEKAKDSVKGSPGSVESKLLNDLEHVSKETSSSELSNFAFEYVKSDTVREVHAKHHGRAPREAGSAWYYICHYIGRLGAWARAVKVVVHFVRDQPQVTNGFQVCSKASPPPIAPPPGDQRTNLEVVFKTMFPKRPDRAEAILTRLRHKTAPLFDIDQEFVFQYQSKSFRPRTHAEVLLLDFFLKQELEFYNDDCFVGSSKPSCYCCDLYFRFHQSSVVTRPTHGNAWQKWCLPPGMLQDHDKLEWEGKIVLKRMTDKIQSDILQLVESEVPVRARVQDSTTGFWTAPTLNWRL